MNNFSMNKGFTKFGAPFLILVLGGSFFLEQFSKLKYQFGKRPTLLDPKELEKEGLKVKDRKEVTLEAQYELMKDLDIDNWEQVRIPRPWDETVD